MKEHWKKKTHWYQRSDGYSVMKHANKELYLGFKPDQACLYQSGHAQRPRIWYTAEAAMAAIDWEFPLDAT